MRVTNTQAKGIVETISSKGQDMTKKNIASDLLKARELINEMRKVFKVISQKSIVYVCEDVRTMAREQLSKSKEYAE